MGDFQYLKQKYGEFSDEDLVTKANNNELEPQEFLIKKYKGLVTLKARTYFLIGGSKEDIIQEGMIGLFKAIRDFDPNMETSFKSFASLCITRQMITAIKTANRQKHTPLNSYVSLDKPVYNESSNKVVGEVLVHKKDFNPEELVISKEQIKFINEKVEELLSDLELKIFLEYIKGKSYKKISNDLNENVKTVDNALQRIKRKLGKHLNIA